MVRERDFNVNGYRIRAREWHPEATFKVLAVHGWLDNAASFDVLAPLLPNCHLIALDLPGHGLSDHKGPQATYHLWDDLLDLVAILDLVGWQRCHLLGHSRGAIMSMMLAAARPDQFHSLTLLDGLWPQPVTVEETAAQLGRFLTTYSRAVDKRLPSYASVEDAARARCEAIGMRLQSALAIAQRGTVQRDNRWYWRSDPRLTAASAFKLTRDHSRALVSALRSPTLLLLAEQGLGLRLDFTNELESLETIAWQRLPGSHHFHMEETAEDIARLVMAQMAANT